MGLVSNGLRLEPEAAAVVVVYLQPGLWRELEAREVFTEVRAVQLVLALQVVQVGLGPRALL